MNRTQTHIKNIAPHDQADLTPKCMDGLTQVYQYMYGLTEKNHLNVSRDAEKALDKNHHAFMIKVLENIGLEGTYLNIIKAM